MVQLNLGCGKDYRDGWVNVDFNREVRTDVYAHFSHGLPFKDNTVDAVLMDHVLEHVRQDDYFAFLEELCRVCKPSARIRIYVPHYTGQTALKHPAHYMYFGVGSFDPFSEDEFFNGERYCNARFRVVDEQLHFFAHKLNFFAFRNKIPINWLFNFNQPWRLIVERFQFLGFDEIYFELEVVK